VKGRCTGTATSTFGGGGGTKVFCSQALKTPIAAIAKPARQAAPPPLRAAVPYGLKRAGEREAFIFSAPIGLFWKRLYSKTGFPPPHENSNNPLAAEPESENDAARFFL
jgi:hypothetical protein